MSSGGELELDEDLWMGDAGEEAGDDEEMEDGSVEKTREELKSEVVKWKWEAETWRELHDTEEMKTEYLRENLEKVKKECEKEIERAREGAAEEMEEARRGYEEEVERLKKEVEKWKRLALHKAEKAKTEGGKDDVNPMELKEVEEGGMAEVKLKEVTVEMVKVEVPERFKMKNKLQIGGAEQDEEEKSGESVDENLNTLKKRKRSCGEGSSSGEGSSGGGGSGRRCDLCGEEFSSLRRHSQVTLHQHLLVKCTTCTCTCPAGPPSEVLPPLLPPGVHLPGVPLHPPGLHRPLHQALPKVHQFTGPDLQWER